MKLGMQRATRGEEFEATMTMLTREWRGAQIRTKAPSISKKEKTMEASLWLEQLYEAGELREGTEGTGLLM